MEWTVGRATIPVEADPSYASSYSTTEQSHEQPDPIDLLKKENPRFANHQKKMMDFVLLLGM